MFTRKDLIDNIIDKLSFLKTKVEFSTPLNLTDTNIIAENFYRDLLNLIYGYNLDNINKIVPNAAAIDLGDTMEGLCIQVTSTNKLVKTATTVKKFIEKDLHQKFKRLVILNIVEKSNHREDKIGDKGTYQLDTKKDIWDLGTLIEDISYKEDVDEIEAISKFLDKEIKFVSNSTVAKEIITFTSLVSLLSDESQPAAGNGYLENPDPENKVFNRFSEHAEYLTNEYLNLYIEYGLVLKDVLEQADMGQARIRRLGLYLKAESDKILTDNNNNPQLALDALVERYEDLLRKAGAHFDKTAIRFFLLDQLVRCNVFPNKVINE
jgi:hypothetical protein